MAENYGTNDFTFREADENWNYYVLNKSCIICGQSFGKEPYDEETALRLMMHKNIEFAEYISEVNKYLKWLGGDCKDVLINGLCEHINEYSTVTVEELVETKWYEELKIYSVLITVTKDGKVGADMSFADNYDTGHILDIGLLEDKICEIGYDG